MIITKLIQKFKVGCGKGVKVTENNLHFILNSVIDWENSEFEVYPEGVTPPKGYSQEKYLSPGDCFVFGKSKQGGEDSAGRMVIALDQDDSLVCILNDTGYKALQRIIDEKIKPEYQLCHGDYSEVVVTGWSPAVTAESLPELDTLMEIGVDKNTYRMVRDQLTAGRGILMGEAYINAQVKSDLTMGMEVPLYLCRYGVYTDKDNMFADIPGFMEDLVQQTLRWLYNEVPVIKPKKPELQAEEDVNA